MPFKDKEAEKEYRKQQARDRRAAAKRTNANKVSATSGVAPSDLKTNSIQSIPPPAPVKKRDSIVIRGDSKLDTSHSPIKTAPSPQAPPAALASPTVMAEEAADKTRRLLDTKGWCIWQCAALNNDRVVIIRDDSATGYPSEYPVYTEKELEAVGEMTPWGLKMVHQAKKLAQGRLFA